jgi:uncharacterized protein YndB with AHSA1/START domain
MIPSSVPSSAEPSGIEIVTTRLFPHSRAEVFGAFAQPERLARWWGPDGFTNTIHEFDFRPGGTWRFVMHGPDGKNYENAAEFVTVEPPARIVFDHLEPMHGFRMTMTFEDVGGSGTRLTWRMRLEDSPENERLRDFLAAANEQNFNRLAHVLESP